MIHLALKTSLMGQNKLKKYFSILICFLLITSCQYQWVEKKHIELEKVSFGSSIKDSFKNKTVRYFSAGASKDNMSLKILNINFRKKNFYGGIAARAKQIEIIGELEYIFLSSTESKNGVLKTSGWIPVNESNPQSELMAQKTIIEELEFSLLEMLAQEYWLIES